MPQGLCCGIKIISGSILTNCAIPPRQFDRNPMRILDCNHPYVKIAEDAPVVTDYLCDDCRAHFEAVQKYLTSEGVEFTVNPHIVRCGFDYCPRTVFEFVSGDIGAGNGLRRRQI